MRHLRLFARNVALPIALVSSFAEGLTAIPGLADLSFWIYQMVHPDNQYENSENFIKDHSGLLTFILLVAACSVLTDYMLEGKNFVKDLRAATEEKAAERDDDYRAIADAV